MARDGDIAEDDCSTDDRKSDSIPAMNGQSHNGITSACDVAAPLISQPGVTALCHSKGLLPSPATTILAEDSTSCSSSGSHHSLQPRTAPGDDGEEMTVKLPDIASSSEANGEDDEMFGMDEDEDFFVADRIDYDNENCPRTEWTPINAPSSDQSSTCQQCKDHDDFDDAVYYMNSGDGTYSISSGSDEDSIPWQAALKLRELSKRRRSELSQDPESYAKVENSGDAWKDAWEG